MRSISKSYLKFRHVPELSHSVYQGINPLKNTLPILCQASLQIVQAPFLTPSYLWKVTKFLVKICQFKFLVMADKHFGLQFFLLFKISDFSLFFM